MMGPRDAKDMLLMDYAAGRLGAAESLLAAALARLDAAALRALRRYEAYGGRLLDGENPVCLADGCLEAVLGRIDAGGGGGGGLFAPPAPSPPGVPGILCDILGDCGMFTPARRWSRLGAGVERLALRAPAARDRLCLMRLAPRAATPLHRHRGGELTLVLEGGYSDGFGHYRKGDLVVIADEGVAHNPVAGEDGCLCLILTRAPLRFDDPFLRLLNMVRGI